MVEERLRSAPIALPLDLDVQRLGNVWHHQVNELADPEDKVLEADDKGQLAHQYLPVDHCVFSMFVSVSCHEGSNVNLASL